MEKAIAKKYVLSALRTMIENGEFVPVTIPVAEDKEIVVGVADVVAYAEHEMELLEKKSAKKSEKKIPAETIERMDMVEQVMLNMEIGEGVSPSQILASGQFAPGTSTQLMRSTLVLLMKDGRVREVKRQGKSSVWVLA